LRLVQLPPRAAFPGLAGPLPPAGLGEGGGVAASPAGPLRSRCGALQGSFAQGRPRRARWPSRTSGAHSPSQFVDKRRRAVVDRWISPNSHLRLASAGRLPFLPASHFPDDIPTVKRQKAFRTTNNYAPFHPNTTVIIRSSSPNLLTVASSFFRFVVWTNRDVCSGRLSQIVHRNSDLDSI
ncbi:hypothetical protein T12_6618, partial [Trichinella patagoniensis]